MKTKLFILLLVSLTLAASALPWFGPSSNSAPPTVNPAYGPTRPTSPPPAPIPNPPTASGPFNGDYVDYAKFGTNASFAPTLPLFENSTEIANSHYLYTAGMEKRHWTQLAFKTIPETRSNTVTHVSDNELSVWVEPNSFYLVKCELFAATLEDSSHGGLNYNFTMPNQVRHYTLLEVSVSTNNIYNYYLAQPYANISLASNNGQSPGLPVGGTAYHHHIIQGFFSTGNDPAQAMTLQWAQWSAGSLTSVTLEPGSYIAIEKAGPEINNEMAFLLATGSSSNTVVNAGRNDGLPVFSRSPDTVTKICAYEDHPYGQGGNLATSHVRYLPAGATNWSSASLCYEKSAGAPGGYLISGLTQIGSTNYISNLQYQEEWPSTSLNSTDLLCNADWDGMKLHFHSMIRPPAPSNALWTATSTAVTRAPNGDLLNPFLYVYTNSGAYYSGFNRSTNNGLNWNYPELLGGSLSETEFVTNGQTLYAYTREGPNRYASTNSGYTFAGGTALIGLTNYAQCKPVYRLGGGGTWIAIYRGSAGGTWQANSTDGITFTNCTQLDSGSEEYADVMSTTNGWEGIYASATANSFGPGISTTRITYFIK